MASVSRLGEGGRRLVGPKSEEEKVPMIHELNTALYIIFGRAELLQNERPDDPVVQEHVSIILEQAEKLQGIIERLRDERAGS